MKYLRTPMGTNHSRKAQHRVGVSGGRSGGLPPAPWTPLGSHWVTAAESPLGALVSRIILLCVFYFLLKRIHCFYNIKHQQRNMKSRENFWKQTKSLRDSPEAQNHPGRHPSLPTLKMPVAGAIPPPSPDRSFSTKSLDKSHVPSSSALAAALPTATSSHYGRWRAAFCSHLPWLSSGPHTPELG